jgi:hypothetical protein
MRAFTHPEKRVPSTRSIRLRAPVLPVSSPADLHEWQAERLARQVLDRPGPDMPRGPAGPGSDGPLPAEVRAYFEPRFGHDFSRVRVHAGARSARSAQALGAQAYTLGNDVVMGEGQYAPHSPAGRELLAHELAHVVQQAGGEVGPMVQRRLLATGDRKDIRAALDLLEPASGFTLQHDPKTGEVTATSSITRPPSVVLAGQLATILGDQKQDAEIHLGRKQAGISFGAFPASPDTPVQEVRIDQMLALEKGVPGAGTATLAHEIIENYHAHGLRDLNWTVAFDVAHEKALEEENFISGELIGPGERRNTFSAPTGSGKKRKLVSIEDHGKYFITWEQSFGGKDAIKNVRKVGRIKVATYTIDGFSAQSTAPPQSAAADIAALAVDMQANPTASAHIEALASAGTTADEKTRLATGWSELVRDKVIETVADKINTSWRRFHITGQAGAKNRLVITLERPDI